MDSARMTLLFHRYVNNICSEEEKQEFLTLVSHNDYTDHLRALMDQLWTEIPDEKGSLAFSRKMIEAIIAPAIASRPAKPERNLFRWGKIAAALALFILSTSLVCYRLCCPPLNAGDWNESSYVTDPGFIKLPDGSTVILNAGSKLEYPPAFNGKVREVSLKGEGYFDIVHDPAREFIVHTGKLKTTVLGTAFNIKAYPDQKDIIVTVTRGKVKVSDDEKTFGIVGRNEQITFNRDRHYAKQKVVDSHRITAWTEKDIFFDDVTLSEATTELEKRFGIKIIISNDQIRNCRFTATFVRGEDPEQILRILCEFNGATFHEAVPGTFNINGGTCPL